MYSLPTWFVSGMCVLILCIKEMMTMTMMMMTTTTTTMMMMMMMIVIIIIMTETEPISETWLI